MREKTESFVYPKFFLRQIVTLQHYKILRMFALFGHVWTFSRECLRQIAVDITIFALFDEFGHDWTWREIQISLEVVDSVSEKILLDIPPGGFKTLKTRQRNYGLCT